MNDIHDNVFRWILDHNKSSRYDFTGSGMPFLDLEKYQIDMDKREFQSSVPHMDELFRERVAELYSIEMDQVLPTEGGSEAIQVASLYLNMNSGRIVVPVPEYEPIYRVPSSYGFNFRTESDPEGMKLSPDESLSFTSPNNPTAIEVRERMPWFLEDSGNLAFVDETFMEFTFPQKPVTLFGKRENMFTSTTMTKFYGIGPFRVGWLMGERDIIRKLGEYRFLSTGSSNALSLYFAMKVLEKREQIRKDVMSLVQNNRKRLKSWLEKMDLQHTPIDTTSFTYIFNKGREDASEMFRKHGVLVAPGRYFMARDGYRLCYLLPEEKFSDGLDELSKYYGGL